jgi:hypothetical protein
VAKAAWLASITHPLAGNPQTNGWPISLAGKQASRLLGKTARPACLPIKRQAGSPSALTGGTPNTVRLSMKRRVFKPQIDADEETFSDLSVFIRVHLRFEFLN